MSNDQAATAGSNAPDSAAQQGWDRAEHWTGVYNRSDPSTVSWYQDVPARSLEMISRCRLAADAPVIDVGGGASLLVDHLLARGHRDLTVLDIAGTALSVARERLGQNADKVQWIASDVIRFHPVRRYALWHDRAVLHFLLDETDRLRYRAVLEAALLPGAQCVFAAFAPDGPQRCSGLSVWQYDGRRLLDMLGPHFRLIEEEREDHMTPSGAAQKFSWCRVMFDSDMGATQGSGGTT